MKTTVTLTVLVALATCIGLNEVKRFWRTREAFTDFKRAPKPFTDFKRSPEPFTDFKRAPEAESHHKRK